MAGRRGREFSLEENLAHQCIVSRVGGFGHVSAQCPSDFQGVYHSCGQWGHTSRFCTAQQAHVLTDEFERATKLMQRHMQMKVNKHMMTLMWVMNKFQASSVL